MAAPTFRAAGLGATNTTTSTTITKPAGTASGDVLLAVVANGGAATAPSTVPSGWTLVASASISTTFWAGVYSLIAGGSEPANYTWSGFADSCAGSMIAISGADTSTPVAASRAQANTNGNIACASITAPVVDCLIVGAAGVDDNQATTDASWACATNPAALTERTDLLSSGGVDTASAIATAPQTVQGATGNLTATLAGSRDNVSFLIAIQPPQTGGGSAAADTLTLTDAAGRAVAAARAAADSTTLTDTAARTTTVARSAADSLTLADTATGSAGQNAAGTDALHLADAATAGSSAARAASDGVLLADAAARAASAARTGSDTLNLADAATAATTRARSSSDTLALTDAASAQTTAARTASDGLALADGAARALAQTRTTSDALALTDAATAAADRHAAAADALHLADTASASTSSGLAAADSLNLADAATRTLGVARSLTESLTLADTATAASDGPPAPSATLGGTARVVDQLAGTATVRGRLAGSARVI